MALWERTMSHELSKFKVYTFRYINISACHASCRNLFFLLTCRSPWLPQAGDLGSTVTIYCQCVTKLLTFVILLLFNRIIIILSVSSEENVNAMKRTECSCQRLTLWLWTMPMPMAIFIQSVYIENATSKSWIMKLVSSNYINVEFWSVFNKKNSQMRSLSSACMNNNQRTAEPTMKFGTENFY
jgi:hypothetical protein